MCTWHPSLLAHASLTGFVIQMGRTIQTTPVNTVMQDSPQTLGILRTVPTPTLVQSPHAIPHLVVCSLREFAMTGQLVQPTRAIPHLVVCSLREFAMTG